jgi:fatty acid desaturase
MMQTVPYTSPDAAKVLALDPAHQRRVGLALAVLIMGAWGAAHVFGVFFYPWSAGGGLGLWLAPLYIALQCWLYVGLFIIAHDCMHGSLVPFRPAVNRVIGGICLTVYAGFNFDVMNRKHHLHHRHSGTDGDPDFDARHPHGFWTWYLKFFTEYFSGGEFLIIFAQVCVYLLIGVLGAAGGAVVAATVHVRHLPAAPARRSSLRRPPQRPLQPVFVDHFALHVFPLRVSP